MACDLGAVLAGALCRFLNRRVTVTDTPAGVALDQRTTELLAAALRGTPDGAGGGRAGRMLATARTHGNGARFKAQDVLRVVRLIEDCERATQRRHQIDRGIIPGALSAREAVIVTRRMHGLR
jgi:hypothetical protein